MRHAEDTDVLALLRAADPVDPAELERTVAPLRESIRRRAIEAGSLPEVPIPAGDRAAVEAGARRGDGRRSGRRWATLGFASFACAAVLALVIILSGGSIAPVDRGAHPGFAEAAVKVAEANPRLLVTAPGWKVVEARSFKPTAGQLYLSDGKERIHLSWLPASFYRDSIKRVHPTAHRRVDTATVAGRNVITVYQQRPALGHYAETIFPPEGGISVELDGAFDEQAWRGLMASVRAVGVEEWLRAMPTEIIRPGALADEVSNMLRGVPVPPGFDASAAVAPTQLTNSFQAAKHLTKAVTCGWVESWTDARRRGDSAAAREAVDAMSGAARWPVLLRMVREKGYRGDTLPAPGYGWPTSIITIGRQMAAGDLERERAATSRGGHVTAEGFAIPKGAYPPDLVTCFPPRVDK